MKKQRFCTPSNCEGECASPVVAVVAAPIGEESVRTAFKSMPQAKLVTWTRTNVVKHALSKYKAKCKCIAFANHASAKLKAQAAQRPCFLHIPPVVLLRFMIEQSFVSELITRTDINGVPVAAALAYEDMQLNPGVGLRKLWEVLGIGKVAGPWAKNSSTSSKLIKVGGEDLSNMFLDFDATEAAFAQVPCLHAQLVATQPKRFEPCRLTRSSTLRIADSILLNMSSVSLAAKEVVSNANRSKDEPFRTIMVSCDESGALSVPHGRRQNRSIHMLCAAAMEKRFAMLGSRGPLDICLHPE